MDLLKRQYKYREYIIDEYFNSSCGSELLLGQIANTNGQYLSKLLIVLVKV